MQFCLFSSKVCGFAVLEISVVEASASIVKTSSKSVMLSRRFSFVRPFSRWKYYLSEETRPGQLYEIGENENGSYSLNANDRRHRVRRELLQRL